MRVNIYAEELPGSEKRVEQVSVVTDRGRFFGVRIYLRSTHHLHHSPEDDDRSGVTFWGPKDKVAALLEEAAAAIRKDWDAED